MENDLPTDSISSSSSSENNSSQRTFANLSNKQIIHRAVEILQNAISSSKNTTTQFLSPNGIAKEAFESQVPDVLLTFSKWL